VLRRDGTLWLNLGDSYSGSGKGGNPEGSEWSGFVGSKDREKSAQASKPIIPPGLKPKDLVGIPWRLAFALQADGWWLRSDIIWSKPNPMPESVTDRPTKSHEYLFLLTKSARYYYDADAIAEPVARLWDETNGGSWSHGKGTPERVAERGRAGTHSGPYPLPNEDGTRNARSVWTIATSPFPEAHFATFPPELPRRCILASSKPGDTVLDPFAGAGTTLLVADRLGRHGIGIELNPAYAAMAERRIRDDAPLFHPEEL
jgi:DNA modification methylase